MNTILLIIISYDQIFQHLIMIYNLREHSRVNPYDSKNDLVMKPYLLNFLVNYKKIILLGFHIHYQKNSRKAD